MRTLPSREALVAAYWRKLATSIEGAYKGRGRVFAKRTADALQTRRRRARGSGAAKGIPVRQTAH
ncbi:MAG TPA: hypothetical protein VGY75_08415 [Candidatus Udaeobacter sp.]|jgi:hypothetical protein|nr:hypothetical protein [Candidatus Udaeobacter sp.]